VIYLLILIVLGHYYRPQSDDLGWFYIVQQLGVKGTLQYLWQTNGGRFFSHLFIIGAVKSGWPISIPWLIPAITISCQWMASFTFLRAVRNHLPDHFLPPHLFFHSLVLTLLPLVLIPQPATALYWYTGAALYQWSYILALFLLTMFLQWLSHKQPIWLGLTVLLLFCTGNTNELSSLFTNLSFIGICFLLYTKKAIPRRVLILLSATAVIALAVNFSAPGLYIRKEIMTANKTFLSAPLSWIFWIMAAAWQIISLPISWVLAADLYHFGKFSIHRKQWWLFAGLLSAALLLLLYGTGGSLAFRTLNTLTVLLFILAMAGIAGRHPQSGYLPDRYRHWIYVLAILASPLTYQMMQTSLSAPHFSSAYDQQLRLIADTALAAPRLDPIQHTMDSLAAQKHHRQLIRQKAKQLPTLLWFNEPGNEKNTLLQMIRIKGKDSVIWGEKHILNDHYSFPGFHP
jgi:hypothetical protein